MIAWNPRVSFHVGPQSARVLLKPIIQEIETLEDRLAHYHGRIPMTDPDKEAVARALEIVTRAKVDLARVQREAPLQSPVIIGEARG